MILCVTSETDGWVTLGLDGGGSCQVATGVPFLDPMLHQISRHGLIDLAQEELGDGIPGMGVQRLRARASAGNNNTDSRLPPTSAASTWGDIRPACTSRKPTTIGRFRDWDTNRQKRSRSRRSGKARR
jgi:hypothetical protein